MTNAKLLGIPTIRTRAKALSTRLGRSDFQMHAEPMHDGSRHVEVSDAYYLVATERGHELDRWRTNDVDELLYWLMEGLTSSMARDYELAHRREGEDTRRQWFAKQVELLAELSPQWAARLQGEQEAVLKQHPFRDA